MFIGHYALALAAKRVAPRTSLGTLFAAATLADLLWPVFLLAGWEQTRIVPGPNPFLILSFDSYPISHSLLTLIGWGALCALLYRMRTGYARGAVLVALLVLSHWVLDFVTHSPDMPLYPGGRRVGLGLWNSVTGRRSSWKRSCSVPEPGSISGRRARATPPGATGSGRCSRCSRSLTPARSSVARRPACAPSPSVRSCSAGCSLAGRRGRIGIAIGSRAPEPPRDRPGIAARDQRRPPTPTPSPKAVARGRPSEATDRARRAPARSPRGYCSSAGRGGWLPPAGSTQRGRA